MGFNSAFKGLRTDKPVKFLEVHMCDLFESHCVVDFASNCINNQEERPSKQVYQLVAY